MGLCSSNQVAETTELRIVEKKVTSEYTLGDVLGEGASCKVQCGERKGDKRKYALKLLKAAGGDQDNEFLFKNEVEILRQVRHPNIVEFFDAFKDSEKGFCIVTVLCQGGELFDRVKEGKFSERVASTLTKQMLLAIKHCHDRNIVHRDLKPENFVFDTPAEDSNMKLIDFGCAVQGADDQVVGDVAGSPYYVAPEVLNKSAVRTIKTWKTSDMWSIGVIVFLMTNGYPPFNGRNHGEIFKRIKKGEYKFRENAKLSSDCQDFIKKLLIKDSTENRMTAKQALQHPWITKQAQISDQPIPAQVIQSLTQFRKSCRLKKAVARAVAQYITPQDKAMLQAIFEKYDTNKDGTLDAKEIEHMMAELTGAGMTEVAQFIKQVDANNDKKIDMQEWTDYHVSAHLADSDQQVKALFDMIDVNKDGDIDVEELKKLLPDLPPTLVKDLISDVDKNNDGRINFNEWLSAMHGAPANARNKGS